MSLTIKIIAHEPRTTKGAIADPTGRSAYVDQPVRRTLMLPKGAPRRKWLLFIQHRLDLEKEITDRS